MKSCPNCGFVPTKTNRQLLKSYDDFFPGMPVLEMIKRRWITISDREDLEEILQKLMNFFECERVEEFKEMFGYEGELLDTEK